MSVLNRGQTIRERYADIGGFTSGFDYLRVCLAVAVVLQHSFVTTDADLADRLWSGSTRVFFAPILPMFFALSGFLVAGSLMKRPSVASFVTLRIIRLLPALAVEIFLSALILGPLLTKLPLSEYFSAEPFRHYFLNLIGIIHFRLPGVFTDLPNRITKNMVNMSLWTIPYELECYVVLVILYVFGIFRRRRLFIAAAFIVFLIGNYLLLFGFEPNFLLLQARPLVGRALVMAFLCGVGISVYADKIHLHWLYATASTALTALLVLRFETSYLAVIPAAYLTVYLGMLNPKHIPVLFSGDYSYGLYLFAFPIQQTYCLLFPHFLVWYANAAFTIFFGFLYAAFSWWIVEKPILSCKQAFVRLTETFASRGIKLPHQLIRLRDQLRNQEG